MDQLISPIWVILLIVNYSINDAFSHPRCGRIGFLDPIPPPYPVNR